MSARLSGKVALLTGGARGLGAAQARRFVDEGARVVIADIADEIGTALAGELGDAAAYRHLDVRSESEWAAGVALAFDRFGRLDALVNNAGVYRTGSLVDMAIEDARLLVDVNQWGTLLGMRAVAPELKRAGGGSIVNVASTAGLRGVRNAGVYAATKHAVIGMTKSAAIELGRFNVRVNVICPGGIDTPILDDTMPQGPRRDELFTRSVPAGRIGRADEVAHLAVFLVSGESSYCTGGAYPVDGGLTAG